MVAAESFVFAKETSATVGRGRTRQFTDVATAADALRSGAVDVVTGAFGFDASGVAALIAPREFTVADAPRTPAADGPVGDPRSGARVVDASVTDADLHRDRIRRALHAIAAGRVEKVVLARTLDARLAEPLHPLDLLRRFPLDARTTGFAVPLDAAPDREGHWLVGASPELLVRREGTRVTCHPFAGSAPRSADPAADARARDRLAASDKDLREHAFVVDAVLDALRPWCADLTYPEVPDVESTPAVWHLATPITGVLAHPEVTALDLAAALSPTPAVCGTPRTAAAELIADVEGPRDFYAGAVGWCDAAGDGEWVVSIRCLELDASGTRVQAWAGGGIVDGSDPDAEVVETVAKFRTVLAALGDASLVDRLR
ncbi:isochorismate synthase [Gordonia shandongensis]|uniref:isochorismate synthase n=1 Tax=Gordonia shandongensis TaxID=376351 RepID=UPI00042220EC|nr:isochorismate synthase [Gordonia shandongensis]